MHEGCSHCIVLISSTDLALMVEKTLPKTGRIHCCQKCVYFLFVWPWPILEYLSGACLIWEKMLGLERVVLKKTTGLSCRKISSHHSSLSLLPFLKELLVGLVQAPTLILDGKSILLFSVWLFVELFAFVLPSALSWIPEKTDLLSVHV